MSNTLPAEPIKLIVGLGNPGVKYEHTRHNAGQDWLAQLARTEGIALASEKRHFGDYGQGLVAGYKVHLLIPYTCMNLRWQSVQPLCNVYKIYTEHLLVPHDQLNLPTYTPHPKSSWG